METEEKKNLLKIVASLGAVGAALVAIQAATKKTAEQTKEIGDTEADNQVILNDVKSSILALEGTGSKTLTDLYTGITGIIGSGPKTLTDIFTGLSSLGIKLDTLKAQLDLIASPQYIMTLDTVNTIDDGGTYWSMTEYIPVQSANQGDVFVPIFAVGLALDASGVPLVIDAGSFLFGLTIPIDTSTTTLLHGGSDITMTKKDAITTGHGTVTGGVMYYEFAQASERRIAIHGAVGVTSFWNLYLRVAKATGTPVLAKFYVVGTYQQKIGI